MTKATKNYNHWKALIFPKHPPSEELHVRDSLSKWQWSEQNLFCCKIPSSVYIVLSTKSVVISEVHISYPKLLSVYNLWQIPCVGKDKKAAICICIVFNIMLHSKPLLVIQFTLVCFSKQKGSHSIQFFLDKNNNMMLLMFFSSLHNSKRVECIFNVNIMLNRTVECAIFFLKNNINHNKS